ncbi:hypothetical protein AB0M02_00505 [Actinoplanes sp. NPDC051861]|uniref:hypothetical protein n=1 Tax=Actinoplanes sp. NPDC051861 TaxID=3155170 RepID=UPI00341AEE30
MRPPSRRPLPGAGDLLRITAAASVQFAQRPFLFRVIRVLPHITYDGWVWLDGYQLDGAGDAVERRSIFVQIGGLRLIVRAQPDARARNSRRPSTGSSGRDAHRSRRA